MTTVSILIPAYNVEDHIEECLTSCQVAVEHAVSSGVIARQDIEIIVADDGSNDGTVLVSKSHADRVLQLGHLGRPQTMNAALDAVCSEWVCWVGGDDRLTPDGLTHLLSKVIEVQDAQLVYGITRYVTADGKTAIGEFKPDQYYRDPDAFMATILVGCPFYMGGVLIQKSVYDRWGKLDVILERSQDHEHFARIAGKIETVRVDEIIYQYRQRPKTYKEMAFEWPYLKHVYARILKQYSLEDLFPTIRDKSPNVKEAMGQYLLAQQYMKIAAWDEAESACIKSLNLVDAVETKRILEKIRLYREGMMQINTQQQIAEKEWAASVLDIQNKETPLWSIDECAKQDNWQGVIQDLCIQHNNEIVLVTNTMAFPEFYGLLCMEYQDVAQYLMPISKDDVIELIQQTGRTCMISQYVEYDADVTRRIPYDETDTTCRFGRLALRIAAR
ncbi:MAG: glycosyltransferase [bacterium]|nr:glycosyltransferase [bacterium]